MASNFRISVHRSNSNLHLRLTGDFDGTSAYQLLDVMKKNCRDACKVIIHTNCLKKIYPFGRNIFASKLIDLKGRSIRVVLTGENAAQIVPGKNYSRESNSYEFTP